MVSNEQEDRAVKFVTRCLVCGADETDTPGVVVSEEPSESVNANDDLLPQVRREFTCETCGTAEVVDTGVVPEASADDFGTTRAPIGDEMPVRINGNSIQYKEIEEYVTETTLYGREGLSTHGRMHQVRIQALDPPTFTQGNAHDVQLGEYLDQRMLLTNVRYYSSDDPWRLLSFSRKLDDGIIDKIESGQHRDRL